MTSLNQASDRTKQTEEQQYTEEQYRTIQKQIPRLRPNTPPVCKNKRSYELITRRTASDTGKVFYECQICRKITNGYGNLNKHCRIHTGEKPYHCTVCGKAFSDKSGYDVHYRIHTGIKPYKCSVCKREFRSSTGLNSHSCIRKSFTCELCQKTFRDQWGLQFHEDKYHGGGDLDMGYCIKLRWTV